MSVGAWNIISTCGVDIQGLLGRYSSNFFISPYPFKDGKKYYELNIRRETLNGVPGATYKPRPVGFGQALPVLIKSTRNPLLV